MIFEQVCLGERLAPMLKVCWREKSGNHMQGAAFADSWTGALLPDGIHRSWEEGWVDSDPGVRRKCSRWAGKVALEALGPS